MNLAAGRFFLLAIVVAILAAGVFSPGLGGGFLLDDDHTIVDNPLIRVEVLSLDSMMDAAASFFAGNGTRPLAMMSFGLDYWRQGALDPAGFKATNLAIHALTALVLAFFLRRLLCMAGWPMPRAALVALTLALVWAVHPLQVSSVLYVVQRMQALASLFVLLALWEYLRLRQAEMDGRPAVLHGLALAACWGLALLSKEDAILLPAYTLVLELAVLGFSAAQPARARALRRVYLLASLAGAALFFLWVVPHYGNSQAYVGRDFNSVERLLTQGRVLVMYLGQILLPLPQLMPFNYDNLAVSRGLLSPATTLPALVALGALLVWAWRWRSRRPVFACGVLWFFAGHFMTSNVIALELAFEHRNYLPSIGILLAVADLCLLAVERWGLAPRWTAAAVGIAVAGVATAGAARAHAWGEPVRFARYSVAVAPDSPRAWLNLGGTYFDLAGRKNGRGNPNLALAIETVEEAAARTGSPSAYSNIVVYKTVQGSVTQADWDALLRRLETAPMLPPTKNILWTTLRNVQADIGLDQTQALKLIDIIARRAQFSGENFLRIGVSIYLHMEDQAAALPYFLRAARALPEGDESIARLGSDLAQQGHPDWAKAVEQASAAR